MAARLTVAGIVLVMATLLTQSAKSEPTPSVTYLMSEPASMWDLGMYRLNKDLSEAEKDLGVLRSVAEYDGDKNRLTLRFQVGEYARPIAQDEAKKLCSNAIFNVKMKYGVDPKSGKLLPIANHDNSWLFLHFVHNGFRTAREPADLGKHLDNMTEIEVSVLTVGANAKPASLYCTSPLVSKEISVRLSN